MVCFVEYNFVRDNCCRLWSRSGLRLQLCSELFFCCSGPERRYGDRGFISLTCGNIFTFGWVITVTGSKLILFAPPALVELYKFASWIGEFCLCLIFRQVQSTKKHSLYWQNLTFVLVFSFYLCNADEYTIPECSQLHVWSILNNFHT